jgi:hypothetical protein
LAAQVRNKPTDEESIDMIIRGAQPSVEALLDLQTPTTFAALIRIETKIEASLQKGNFSNITTQKSTEASARGKRPDTGRGTMAMISPSSS